jgi:hypothetical protein
MPSFDVRKWLEPGGFGEYESATMRLVRALVVVLAAALSTLAAADPAVAQFTIGGDPRVNPNDFRITTFASGLNYPNGLARLSDGSILVATSNPNGSGTFFASSGALLRCTDTNRDGIADGPGQVMYSDLLGVWVALKVGAPPSGNEENPLVFSDLGTGQYFHFIEAFQLGHGDQLLSTEDSLFIADMSANGSVNTNGGAGVIYQIASRQAEAIRVFITQPDTDGTTVSGVVWFTIWLENTAAGTRNLTLSIDGVPVGSTDSTANGPISMPWSTAGAVGGTHTATVSVLDGAGNGGSASRTVVIPSVSVFITSPAATAPRCRALRGSRSGSRTPRPAARPTR